MCYKASESQVDKISIITSPVVSFLPLAGHWTAPDSDGGKTNISPQAKTVSCENTITAIRDAFCDANTLKSTRANPLKHGSLILNRGGLLMFQSSHNKAGQGPWISHRIIITAASVIRTDPAAVIRALSSWSQAVTRYRLWHESWPGCHVSWVCHEPCHAATGHHYSTNTSPRSL